MRRFFQQPGTSGVTDFSIWSIRHYFFKAKIRKSNFGYTSKKINDFFKGFLYVRASRVTTPILIGIASALRASAIPKSIGSIMIFLIALNFLFNYYRLKLKATNILEVI